MFQVSLGVIRFNIFDETEKADDDCADVLFVNWIEEVGFDVVAFFENR